MQPTRRSPTEDPATPVSDKAGEYGIGASWMRAMGKARRYAAHPHPPGAAGHLLPQAGEGRASATLAQWLRRHTLFLFLAPAVALFVGFVAYPILWLVDKSLLREGQDG